MKDVIKKYRRIVCIAMAVFFSVVAGAQSPLQYLEQSFPKLTEIYREDIDKCHAHYIFAIDVSGSMDKYEGIMVPLLKNFIHALPSGDRVTVIPFGTDVKNPMGFSGIISDEMKQTLCSNMERLYRNPNYDQLFKDHTNIYKAVNEISKTVVTNSEYKVNIMMPFTDFLNNIPKVPPHQFNKRRLTDEELADMRRNLKAAVGDSYVRCIAVELTDEGADNSSQKEYCLDQLRDEVFSVAGSGLETIQTNNSKEAIGQWFEQLRREILIVKLRAITESENRAGKVLMNASTDIDGNTEAHITWTPNRLYSKIKIDSTYLSRQGFTFVNDTSNYGSTRDSQIDVELGKIRHIEYGFHYLNDSLSLGISLPTDFDHELDRLGLVKPISEAKCCEDRWIFTFFLPLWLTVLLLILLIAYVILFIRAVITNSKDRISGKVTVADEYGMEIMTRKITSCENFTVGSGGDYRVDNAEWQIVVKKVKPSPFLLFRKPYYRWSSGKGYAGTKTAQEGRLDKKNNSIAKIRCGRNKREITNKTTIKLVED